MIEEAERATVANSQVKDASLPGDRRAPDAATELLEKVRQETGHVKLTEADFTPVRGLGGDEDIPFQAGRVAG